MSIPLPFLHSHWFAAIALLVAIAPLIWTLASVAALGASLVLAAGLRVQAPETTAVSFD